MRLALLKGNRFNPWHFPAYARLRGEPEVTVFRAESEIQAYFDARNDAELGFGFEPIHFDTQRGHPLLRAGYVFAERYLKRPPRVLPFFERLRGFDVIQSWELFTDWSKQALLARERFGTPLAVMVWDNIPFSHDANAHRRAFKHQVIQGADRFIVHTERSRRMLALEGAPMERVALVPPGVDTEVFCPGPGARGDLGLPEDAFVILFVGWLLPRKGIDFLLLALRELLDNPETARFNPYLLAVGSGPGEQRVACLAEQLGLKAHCRFAGSLPHGAMPGAYRSADAFVLPSIAMPDWQEQFGMALLEAMACGAPVVATRSGAIPEIAGDEAMLCQPNDFVSLADALGELMMHPEKREALGRAGRERALNRFTVGALAENLSTIYEELIKEAH